MITLALIDITEGGPDGKPLNITWIPEKWWKLVTETSNRKNTPTHVDRRQFEVCLFSQVMTELKAGDICIEGSDKFSDYREQLVSWDEYDDMVGEFAEQVGLSLESSIFVQQLQSWLEQVASATDASFPSNKTVRIEDGIPKLSRLGRRPDIAQTKEVERLIADRLQPINILDVLVDTENWLGWTKFFGPLSGYDARIPNPRERYVTTAFCYGCGLGPSQTSLASTTANLLGPTNERVIKFNHLVANCLIFHNVQSMSRILKELALEGREFDDEVLSRLGPYLTGHVNRFGKYPLNMNRNTQPLSFAHSAAMETLGG